MFDKFIGLNLDFAGALTSFACAIHCAAAPLLISFGVVGGGDHQHTFDWVFLGAGLVIALFALVGDYIKKHRSPGPLLLGFLGFVVLFFGIQSCGQYPIVNVLGGLMILASHLYNYKLTHKSAAH